MSLLPVCTWQEREGTWAATSRAWLRLKKGMGINYNHHFFVCFSHFPPDALNNPLLQAVALWFSILSVHALSVSFSPRNVVSYTVNLFFSGWENDVWHESVNCLRLTVNAWELAAQNRPQDCFIPTACPHPHQGEKYPGSWSYEYCGQLQSPTILILVKQTMFCCLSCLLSPSWLKNGQTISMLSADSKLCYMMNDCSIQGGKFLVSWM